MIEVVPLAKIKSRGINPGDDLTELEASLRKDGLKVPLLLNGNHVLVDGARRLQAIKNLGLTDAVCQVTDDFDEAMANLTQARKGEHRVPISHRRLYEQYTLISVMGFARASRRRLGVPLKRGIRGAERGFGFREEYTALIDNPKKWVLDRTMTAYRGLDNMEPGPNRDKLLQLLAKVEQTGEGPTAASKFARQIAFSDPGARVTLAQQRQIFRNTVSSMEGLHKGLKSIGDLDPDLPREEVEEFISDIKGFVSKMRTFANQLERQLSE